MHSRFNRRHAFFEILSDIVAQRLCDLRALRVRFVYSLPFDQAKVLYPLNT